MMTRKTNALPRVFEDALAFALRNLHKVQAGQGVSPGHQPNSLAVEKIRARNSNLRNPMLASYVAKRLLPYRGLESGVPRVLESWPRIYFGMEVMK